MTAEAAPFNHESSLRLGPWLRHADHETARVVLRARPATDEGGEAFEARATPEGGRPGACVPLLTRAAWAGTGLAAVPLAGPAGGRVAIEVRGAAGRVVGSLHLRRPEAPAREGRIAVVFGSCWLPGSVPDEAAAWSVIGALGATGLADHLLLLGDAIYADRAATQGGVSPTAAVLALGPDAPLADRLAPLREAWERSLGVAAVQRALSALPSVATWDDHEIVNGYGSEPWHHSPRGLALLEAAGAAFDETLGLGNPEPAAEAGSLPTAAAAMGSADSVSDPLSRARAFRVGPAVFVLLDLRTRRNAARRVLLGAGQRATVERWVLEEHRDAPVVFIASSVPPVHLPDFTHRLLRNSDLMDQWSSEANEEDRRWLLSLVETIHADPRRRALILAGDAHVASVATITGRGGRTTWQVTSSPLANTVPWWVRPALTLAAPSFRVRSREASLGVRILRRLSGPNVGLIRGEARAGAVRLSAQLLRPGRRTFQVALD